MRGQAIRRSAVYPVLLAALLTGLVFFPATVTAGSLGTVQATAASTTFAIIGDYGMDNADEAAVAGLVASWSPAYIIATGDDYYAAAGGTGTGKYDESTGAYYGAWLKDISTTGTRCPVGLASVNAFFPAMGNHDYNDATPAPDTYLEYFTLPGVGFTNTSGNERYYDFVEGPIHFFVLDSNSREPAGTSSTSTQAKWLQARLAASTSPWNIVYDHHPPYSSDSYHGSATYMEWPFAEWGADAVVSGHAHTYERVMRDGIVYFVNGLGGAPRYGFGTPVTGSAVRYSANWGAQKVTVSDTALTFAFYNVSGTLIDSYTLTTTPAPPKVPTVTALAPAYGLTSGGNTVTIGGTNLSGATAVKFGGTRATSVTVVSPTKLTAKAPAHAAGLVNVYVTTPGGTSSGAGTANDYSYLSHYEQSASSLAFSSGWSTFSTASAYGGSYSRGTGTGVSVVIPFTGDRLDWIATRGVTMGTARVYVDNLYKATINLYNAGGALYRQRVWSTGTLPYREHFVTIKWSSGGYVSLDALEVRGSLLSAATVQETDPRLSYTPAWKSASSSSASGGSYRYVNSSGAQVSMSFTGIGLSFICKKAPTYGKATVILDGKTVGTIDFYGKSITYKARVFSLWAPYGPHTVVLKRTGTKNASSTGYTITLDAVEVRGSLK